MDLSFSCSLIPVTYNQSSKGNTIHKLPPGGETMIYAVVPAMNEEKNISSVIRMLLDCSIDKIIVVVNGCTDSTYKVVSSLNDSKIKIAYFDKPLGIDIPRAVGAKIARESNCDGAVFIDGDMSKDISNGICEITKSIKDNAIDLALSDCYYNYNIKSDLAKYILAFRKQLNIELGIFDGIGVSTPSHGPHGVSKKLLQSIHPKEFAIPPVILSMGVIYNLNIRVVTQFRHESLESKLKSYNHAEEIAKTIIGDCIEALCVYRGEFRNRGYGTKQYLGLHKGRRFDILDEFINNFSLENFQHLEEVREIFPQGTL